MAKIGCLKPFRGSYNSLSNVILEDGEIVFETTNKRIYMGNGVDSVSSLTPFINIGNTDISNIGDGSITGAISTLNSNVVARGKMLGCIELPPYTYNNADDLPEGYTQFSRASNVSNLPTNISPAGGELYCIWGYRRFQLFIDWEGFNLWFRGYNVSTASFNSWGRLTTSAT